MSTISKYNDLPTWSSFSDIEIQNLLINRLPHLKMYAYSVLLKTYEEVKFELMVLYLWQTLISKRASINEYPYESFISFLSNLPSPAYSLINWKYFPNEVNANAPGDRITLAMLAVDTALAYNLPYIIHIQAV